MKQIKKTAAFLLAAVLTLSGFTRQALGNTFPSDVPDGHWAYNSIDKITNLGLMSGMTLSRFGVEQLISKFDVARTLAILAGYKMTGATYEETVYYESLYEKHYPSISQYSSQFEKWKDDYDMQIAYLLELGVFTPLDIGNFILIENNEERFRAVYRFEICVYLVRLLGWEEDARYFVPDVLFADDSNITTGAKAYIYYARQIGLVSGDGNGYFNPDSGLTKGALAVMLDITIGLMGYGSTNANSGGQQTQPAQQGTSVTVMGTINTVHPSFRALELRSFKTGEREMYQIPNNASIMINGEIGFFDMLQANMSIAGILSNGELSDIAALTQSAPAQQANQPSQTPPPNIANPDYSALSPAEIEGIVRGTKTIGDKPYIDIEVKLINLRGEIIEEDRTFLIDDSCTITRGGTAANFNSINADDIATISILGVTAYSINLEEKFRSLAGTVTGKRSTAAANTGILTVTDPMGRVHELTVNESSAITRTGKSGKLIWSDIRIGDGVTVSAEYNRVISINAVGTSNIIDVIITKINMSTEGASISGTDNGKEENYPIIPNSGVDVYALRIGGRVRLGLDSKEIENIITLEDPKTNEFTGRILSISGNKLIVQNTADTTNYKNFTFDSNTSIVEAVSGAWMNTSSLMHNMLVYLVFDETPEPDYITSLTILGY